MSGQSKQTRQGDWVSPPEGPTSIHAVHAFNVATSAGNTDLHSGLTSALYPDGYYITVEVVSGGPVHFFFASGTGTAATADTGWTLSAGEKADFLLAPPINATGAGTGTLTYPHRYIMHIATAAAQCKWYVSTDTRWGGPV